MEHTQRCLQNDPKEDKKEKPKDQLPAYPVSWLKQMSQTRREDVDMNVVFVAPLHQLIVEARGVPVQKEDLQLPFLLLLVALEDLAAAHVLGHLLDVLKKKILCITHAMTDRGKASEK